MNTTPCPDAPLCAACHAKPSAGLVEADGRFQLVCGQACADATRATLHEMDASDIQMQQQALGFMVDSLVIKGKKTEHGLVHQYLAMRGFARANKRLFSGLDLFVRPSSPPSPYWTDIHSLALLDERHRLNTRYVVAGILWNDVPL